MYSLSAQTSSLHILLAACLCLTVVWAACSSATNEEPTQSTAENTAHNTLSDEELADGWKLLFDGASFEGWRGMGREDIPEAHWIVEEGAIRKVASGEIPTADDGQPLEGGDIMTIATFQNFELQLEWKISPAGNSGIKYNVSEEMSTAHPPIHAALGFEYQILDDMGHPDAQNGPNRTAGALYDMIPPSRSKSLKPVGEFNHVRLIFNGTLGEHWLNGQLVVEYDLQSSRFDSLLAASKYSPIDGFADQRSGHIVLQDHSDDVWFRNIKIRELPPSTN